jgi:hypothetical protein
MAQTQTPTISQFPIWATNQEETPMRYDSLPTAQTLKDGLLFGIPLTSALTGQTLSDETLDRFIREAISEIEHTLDIYITPVTFKEKHDYNREMFQWSFAYVKLNHPNVINVKRVALSFNNNFEQNVAVDFPLEFVHVMPQEGVIQLVPATNTSIGGYVLSAFSGIQYGAIWLTNILNYPGSLRIEYTAGFECGKVPALITALIQTLAAIRVLSTLGPILFPYNSVSVGLDGVSQGTSTMGPAFLRQRIDELNKIKEDQMNAAKGYYQRAFLIDHI